MTACHLREDIKHSHILKNMRMLGKVKVIKLIKEVKYQEIKIEFGLYI